MNPLEGEGEGGAQDRLFRTWREAHEALGLDKIPDWFELEAERKAKEKEEAAQAGGGGEADPYVSLAHHYDGGMGCDPSQEEFHPVPAAPTHMGRPW